MTAAIFRPVSTIEREIIDAMLSQDFAGRDELRSQLADASVRTIDSEGSLEFDIASGDRAPVSERIVAEAWYRDDDGMVVNLLFHVLDGFAKELEFYKDDSSPITRAATAELLQLGTRFDENGRTRSDAR